MVYADQLCGICDPVFTLFRGKVPLKDLENMFPGMSGDFTSENFSATWYLMDNHSSTRSVHLLIHSFICFVSAGCVCLMVCCVRCCSFEQLRLAVGNLKKQASKKNEGSLAYVKGGLSTFFEAQDALACKSAYLIQTHAHNHQ